MTVPGIGILGCDRFRFCLDQIAGSFQLVFGTDLQDQPPRVNIMRHAGVADHVHETGMEPCQSADQIDTMIGAAVMSAERYYPALQLLIWGDRTPKDAIQVAIAEAYGRA